MISCLGCSLGSSGHSHKTKHSSTAKHASHKQAYIWAKRWVAYYSLHWNSSRNRERLNVFILNFNHDLNPLTLLWTRADFLPEEVNFSGPSFSRGSAFDIQNVGFQWSIDFWDIFTYLKYIYIHIWNSATNHGPWTFLCPWCVPN